MKKFIIFLLSLIVFSSVLGAAYAVTGHIDGIIPEKVTIATEGGSYDLDLTPEGNYSVDENSDFTIFAPLPKGYQFEGTGWQLSENGDNAWITIANGNESIPELNIYQGSNGTIAVSAFLDENMNGIRGKYELSLEGINVELFSSDGNLIASGTTAEDEILFQNVPVGEYYIRFTSGSDYFFTKLGNGNIDNQNSITDRTFDTYAESLSFSVGEGETIHATSALYFASSMEGKVWLDENNNGIMDDGEASFSDISIVAHSRSSKGDYEAKINQDGSWSLAQIPYGEYELRVQLPDGYLFAPYSLEGRELRSIVTEYTKNYASRVYKIGKGQKHQNMNVGVVKPASVEVNAFVDSNYNGIKDVDEAGLQGVSIELIRDNLNKVIVKGTTDENGKVYFPTVRENKYRIRAILPSQDLEFTKVAEGDIASTNYFANDNNRKDSNIYNIEILNNQNNSISVGVAKMIDFGGKVYLDSNSDGQYNNGEKAFPNVEIKAYNEDGKLIYSTKSNAKGEYRIEGLYTGKVRLEFKAVKDYMFVVSHGNISNWLVNTDGETANTDFIDLTMGEDITDIDAGLIPRAKIEGRIFEDLNDNGLDDDGQGFEGMLIELLDDNQNVVLSENSDTNGSYVFDGIIPGKYYLRYTINEESEFAEYNSAGNTFDSKEKTFTSEAFKFKMGENTEALLGGAVRIAHIDAKAFIDNNANGVFDNEPALKDIKIKLSSSNKKQESVELSASDSFNIDNIRPGLINISIDLPEGYIFSLNSYNLSGNSGNIKIGQKELLKDANISIAAIKPSKVSTSAWLDEDMDNSYTSVDKAYQNAKFLLISSNGKTEKYIANENGELIIDNVIAGNYRLALLLDNESQPVNDLKSENYAGAVIGYRDISVKAGETLQVEKFGAKVFMSVSGKLYVDDEQQIPVANHKLMLYKGSELIGETQSDENGKYIFKKLKPGKYHIELSKFNNAIFVNPEDKNFKTNCVGELLENTAKSIDLNITMPNSLENIDFIGLIPAKVGDIAWIDLNKNGLQDIDEPVLSNVNIELEQDGKAAYSTISNGNGFYIFDDVYPGKYRIKVKVREGLGITKVNTDVPEINSALSNLDGDIAYSEVFEIKSGEKKYNMDLGFITLDGFQLGDDINDPITQDWSGQTEHTNVGWSR